jgi:hypothetical protein
MSDRIQIQLDDIQIKLAILRELLRQLRTLMETGQEARR